MLLLLLSAFFFFFHDHAYHFSWLLTWSGSKLIVSDKTVTNILSTKLTQEQLETLKLGLNHFICPIRVNKSDVFSCFARIYYTMQRNLKDTEMAGKLATDLSHLAHSYVSTFKPSKKDIQRHKILKGLKSNNNIVILKPDKGNGVVVMDRSDYNQGLQKIIRDHTKFKQLKEDQTLKREKMLQRLLRKLKDKNLSFMC